MPDLSRYIMTPGQDTALSTALKQFGLAVGGVSDAMIHSFAASAQILNLEHGQHVSFVMPSDTANRLLAWAKRWRTEQGPTIGRKRRARRARGRAQQINHTTLFRK